MRPLSARGLGVTLAALLALAGGSALWACAPFLSNWLLGEDRKVLEGPSSRFVAEIERLVPAGENLPQAVQSEAADETAEAEAADLAELPGIPPERRRALTEAVRQVREKLGDPAAAVTVPAGLPGELADYLTGAVAYHRERFDEARRAWERLLARPAAERRRRSVWAAYMLGRTAVALLHPAEAIRRFAQTRKLAREGFADRLGLAAASLGWEARAELDRGRFARAAELYLQQQAAGDSGTQVSLRATCLKALAAGRPALLQMARRGPARRVMTACVITPYHPAYDEPHELREPDAAAWLAAVREVAAQVGGPGEAVGVLGGGHRGLSTADERRRARASRAQPFQRFHYRYRAAGLAREAAALLPDGTEEKARLLATAGSWLKARDPEAALPFYRELVRCCGETPAGRAARELRWLPAADACPAETISPPPP